MYTSVRGEARPAEGHAARPTTTTSFDVSSPSCRRHPSDVRGKQTKQMTDGTNSQRTHHTHADKQNTTNQ